MLLVVVVYPAYEMVAVALFGRTLGMAVAHVAVVSAVDGTTPSVRQSVRRFVVLTLPLLVPLAGVLGSLVIFAVGVRHPLKQGWHDRVAETVVVSTDT